MIVWPYLGPIGYSSFACRKRELVGSVGSGPKGIKNGSDGCFDVSGSRRGKLICQSYQNGHSESDLEVLGTLPCAAQCAHLAVLRTVHDTACQCMVHTTCLHCL